MTESKVLFRDFVDINPKVVLRKGEVYPFVAMEAVTPGRRYIEASSEREYTGGGAKFGAGDVLFARITPCLENGKIAQFKSTPSQSGFGSTEFFIFRNRPAISDSSYIYYLCQTDQIHGPAERSMSGASGRQRADINSVANILVDPVPIPTQRKIAAVLSAYDDLIENNARRIKILEEMAQAIYREWFVDFRFPGHEKVKMVESPLGKIPEGWTWRTLGEVTHNFDAKRKPLSSMERATIKGQIPYYGAAKIIDHINDYIFDGKYLLVAEDGSVITKDRRPVLQLVNGKFWANNHTHILQGKGSISTNYLYLTLSNYDISGHITGAAQPKITQDNLNRIPVIEPLDSLLAIFGDICDPLIAFTDVLAQRNANLRATRDLLLPKLISGEIDVSALDIQTERAGRMAANGGGPAA